MNYKVFENKNFPYLIVDDWYNKEEEKSVWKELDFYYADNLSKMLRTETTEDVAKKENELGEKQPLSKSFRIQLNQFFTPIGLRMSSIQKYMDKLRKPEFHNIVKQLGALHRLYFQTSMDSTMISYYENNDHYHTHMDYAKMTVLIWFFKEPKRFEGGDLQLVDTKEIIEVKHNRLIMFPGFYEHAVFPVKMKEQLEPGLGRTTITHFFFNSQSD
jgi:Rps23 Pro-64 3,4-dihydroxylase Tpa1-like proline 4-hydroxylase